MEIENTCARFYHVVDRIAKGGRVGRLIQVYGPRSLALGPLALLWVWRGALSFLDASQGRRRPTWPRRRALHSRTIASGRYFMHAAASLSIERSAIGTYVYVIGDALPVWSSLYTCISTFRVSFERSWSRFLTVGCVWAESVLLQLYNYGIPSMCVANRLLRLRVYWETVRFLLLCKALRDSRTSNTAEPTRTALNLEREIDMSVYSHVR